MEFEAYVSLGMLNLPADEEKFLKSLGVQLARFRGKDLEVIISSG